MSIITVLVRVFLVSAGTFLLLQAFGLEWMNLLDQIEPNRNILLFLGGLALFAAFLQMYGNETSYRLAQEEVSRIHTPLIEREYEEKFRVLLEREFKLSPEEVEEEMDKFRKKQL